MTSGSYTILTRRRLWWSPLVVFSLALAGRSHDCFCVWFAGQPELLRLFQRTLFRQRDPVSGDAVHLLYTLLCTLLCERGVRWLGIRRFIPLPLPPSAPMRPYVRVANHG